MATRVISKTELRNRIRNELAELGEDALLVTERGRPVAVALSVERWNELQDRIEDLEDVVAILEARHSGDCGKPAESALAAIDADVRPSARSAG
jgi:prevent-host-death family protein